MLLWSVTRIKATASEGELQAPSSQVPRSGTLAGAAPVSVGLGWGTRLRLCPSWPRLSAGCYTTFRTCSHRMVGRGDELSCSCSLPRACPRRCSSSPTQPGWSGWARPDPGADLARSSASPLARKLRPLASKLKSRWPSGPTCASPAAWVLRVRCGSARPACGCRARSDRDRSGAVRLSGMGVDSADDRHRRRGSSTRASTTRCQRRRRRS